LIRKFAVGNLLKEAFEVYKTGNALEAVFEKLYTPPSNSSNQEDDGPYDPFNSINNKIFHQLSYDNLHSHILNIIVPTNDLETQYSDQNIDECLKRINLNAFLDRKSEEGKQLRYWKATNKIGHWNHEAHALIAEFLSNELFKVIAK
jgi:hypothetical protein